LGFYDPEVLSILPLRNRVAVLPAITFIEG
jgi:hypothetical protein